MHVILFYTLWTLIVKTLKYNLISIQDHPIDQPAKTPKISGYLLSVLSTPSTSQGLTLVWRRLLADSRVLRLSALGFTKDGRSNIQQPHNAGHNGVGSDIALLWWVEVDLLRQLETQSTIDDTESDHKAAYPDVCVRPEDSLAVFLKREVVDETQEWLQEEQQEANYADDWVLVVHHVDMCRHPDSHGEGGDVYDVC